MTDNNGPPNGVPADELWARITSVPRPSRLVDIPRNDVNGNPVGQVLMQVLSQAEQNMCAANAEEFAKKRMKLAYSREEQNIGYEDVYRNEAATQVICMAARSKEDPRVQAFPSADKMRVAFTSDEIAVLLQSYMMVQRELGPIVSRMSPEEMDAWIEKLQEGGAAFPLVLLSSEAKNDLVMHLVSRLSDSSTDTSSPGSQPSDGSTETPPTETNNDP